MKFEYVAFCSNSNNFWGDEIKNLDFTKKFPGASWLPFLAIQCEKIGIKVVSGKYAIEKKLPPHKILIIQELISKHGKKLIKMGSTPFIIMSGESKLYAYYYYDFFNWLSKEFKYKLTFFNEYNNLERFYFPSFFYQNL